MKGMTLLASLSDVRDSLIEESLMMFDTPAEELCPKGQSAFSRFLNSGLGVAMICTVVSLGVLMGIIRAGQNPPVGTPGVSDGTTGYEEESSDVSDMPEETESETESERKNETTPVDPPENPFSGVIVDPNPTVPTPNIPTAPDPRPEWPTINWDPPRPQTPSVPRPNVPTPGPSPWP